MSHPALTLTEPLDGYFPDPLLALFWQWVGWWQHTLKAGQRGALAAILNGSPLGPQEENQSRQGTVGSPSHRDPPVCCVDHDLLGLGGAGC